MTQDAPKPGPHLHQPPTLAVLAEMHARYAHDALTIADDSVEFGNCPRLRLAEAHAAVARACAHAALARRPQPHRAYPIEDRLRAGVAAALADRDRSRSVAQGDGEAAS